MKINKVVRRYVITFILGLIIFYFTARYRGLFSVTNKKQLYMALSDGFLLPSFMILGFGGLIIATNSGLFDICAYSVGKLKQMLTKEMYRDKKFPETFFDYKLKYEDRKVSYIYLLVVGGFYLLLSILFNYLFVTL